MGLKFAVGLLVVYDFWVKEPVEGGTVSVFLLLRRITLGVQIVNIESAQARVGNIHLKVQRNMWRVLWEVLEWVSVGEIGETCHRDHYPTLFERWQGVFHVQCPIDRASHTMALDNSVMITLRECPSNAKAPRLNPTTFWLWSKNDTPAPWGHQVLELNIFLPGSFVSVILWQTNFNAFAKGWLFNQWEWE